MRFFFLRKTFLIVGLFCLLSGVVSAQENQPYGGEISEDNINLRVDSTPNAEIISTLKKNTHVEVVREAYEWCKIRLPKDSPSYIRKNLTECLHNEVTYPDPAAKIDHCTNAKILVDTANIRLHPNESSWILGKANKNEFLNILDEENHWYKIEPPRNCFGWVHKKFVKKILLEAKTETITEKEIKIQENVSSKATILEGTVEPYGVVLWRKATHKLITKDAKVFLLKGDKKGLDTLNFHKVRIEGEIISGKEEKYPIINITKIEEMN